MQGFGATFSAQSRESSLVLERSGTFRVGPDGSPEKGGQHDPISNPTQRKTSLNGSASRPSSPTVVLYRGVGGVPRSVGFGSVPRDGAGAIGYAAVPPYPQRQGALVQGPAGQPVMYQRLPPSGLPPQQMVGNPGLAPSGVPGGEPHPLMPAAPLVLARPPPGGMNAQPLLGSRPNPNRPVVGPGPGQVPPQQVYQRPGPYPAGRPLSAGPGPRPMVQFREQPPPNVPSTLAPRPVTSTADQPGTSRFHTHQRGGTPLQPPPQSVPGYGPSGTGPQPDLVAPQPQPAPTEPIRSAVPSSLLPHRKS